jgi:hypothetical protein
MSAPNATPAIAIVNSNSVMPRSIAGSRVSPGSISDSGAGPVLIESDPPATGSAQCAAR